jgi:histidine ammonia-lyase
MTRAPLETLTLTPGAMSLAQLRAVRDGAAVVLDPACREKVARAADVIAEICAGETGVYGVNTGFGKLAQKRIPGDQLAELQHNLVLSHAAGVGAPLPPPVVRLVLAMKVNALAQGHSGVRWEVLDALVRLLDHDLLPVIPAKGSVGASGDLAPLAHMSAVLLGVGEVVHDGQALPAREALEIAGLAPLTLAAKEGLALLNGTQVSTALALDALFRVEDVFSAAVTAGALSVDAARASAVPFDPRIQAVRGQPGQARVAEVYAGLLSESGILASHANCGKIQDPYCLRCQPQVMGTCLDTLGQVAETLAVEANAVSDNPLIFPDTGDVLSGGNFHAEPVAQAADRLAVAATEIANLAERRIALLIDDNLSGLPPFLVAEPGVNSGFMIAQVTAAALVSECKGLAHPASVDSVPTSANQEDHVSMATYAARRCGEIAANARSVVAIELLAAAQGIDFHRPLQSSPPLENAMSEIRARVPFYDRDRYMAGDIAAAEALVDAGGIGAAARHLMPSCLPAP